MPSKKDRRAYYKAYREAQKKHSHRVVLNLTPEQYELLEQEAQARNIPLKTLVMEDVRASLLTPPPDTTAQQNELKELMGLVKPIADTINRIARETNTNQYLKDENGLLLELKKLEDTVQGFIESKTEQQS